LATEYDEKEDIIRVKVKAKVNTHSERLQYFIDANSNNKGRISVAWEKLKIELPFLIK